MWFDEPFEKTFRRMSNRFFNWDDTFDRNQGGQVQTFGPYYYGYEMTVGRDGKPHLREWGNVRPPTAISEDMSRTPIIDDTVSEKEGILKLVTEMPGIEKSDITVNVADDIVSISAQRGERKYHAEYPLKYKVDKNNVKAKYTNGILEVTLTLAKEEPKGKRIQIE